MDLNGVPLVRTCKKKIVIISFILIPILMLGILYINYQRLPVYTWTENHHVIYKNMVFKSDLHLFKEFTDGRLKTDQVIGKTADSKFFGFKTTIYKAKGIDKNEVIIIQGLMFDDVLKRQRD